MRVEDLREKDFGLSEGKKFGAKEADDGSESHESMRRRVDQFLDRHLCPIIDQHAAENAAVAVVSHGIILNVLLKALLARYPAKPPLSLLLSERRRSEYLSPWSNTGVLQANLEPSESNATSRSQPVHFIVEHVNNVDHLQGLKKTRGGIGSAKFDSRQRTMDSFFAPSTKRKFDDTRDQ
jgi:probable phosphoglycerate mutase